MHTAWYVHGSYSLLQQQVIEVELRRPTGGAVIGTLSVAEIRVLANDEPYGVLEFSSNRTDVNETDTLLSVQRRWAELELTDQ